VWQRSELNAEVAALVSLADLSKLMSYSNCSLTIPVFRKVVWMLGLAVRVRSSRRHSIVNEADRSS